MTWRKPEYLEKTMDMLQVTDKIQLPYDHDQDSPLSGRQSYHLQIKIHDRTMYFYNNKYFLIGLDTSPVSQQHARCMCGHTPLHRKTLHPTPNIPRHTAVLNMTITNGDRRQNYQGNKHSNKALWLMLAGTGLFSYSVCKNIHVTIISWSILHNWTHVDIFRVCDHTCILHVAVIQDLYLTLLKNICYYKNT
jgi:hypothetical protein